ncbi:MAG: uracil-DNA glycosylase [Boseongicola sp. SB0677_bin_26]|nr:uracil-DNA glycosylase [Boseongicola sp. SB0665_bin_10]MYG24434.1 uracil-DNA glycosylase [Boseongicola sp. SB0677_bin_26]
MTGNLGAWAKLPFFAEDWPGIAEALSADKRRILPPASMRFAALERCQPAATRAVILGQDPYPTPGHANGLAFSVTAGTALPKSLGNIFRELDDDIGRSPATGDLAGWADAGVLLLNTALTVPEGVAGGHLHLGWDALVAQVLRRLSDSPRAFILWGKHAEGYAGHVLGDHHLILTSAHPSPLSAHRGFFGSRPFSRVNSWLQGHGHAPIPWA